MKKIMRFFAICLLAIVAVVANASTINYGYETSATFLMFFGVANLFAEFFIIWKLIKSDWAWTE